MQNFKLLQIAVVKQGLLRDANLIKNTKSFLTSKLSSLSIGLNITYFELQWDF